MRKLRALSRINIILIVSFYIAFSCQNTIQTREIAQLESDSVVFNVGALQKDSVHIFNFYLKSVGDVPLVIDTVRRNCACSNLQFPKRPIYKGDSARFTITYTPYKSDSGKFITGFIVRANLKKYFARVYFTGTLIK